MATACANCMTKPKNLFNESKPAFLVKDKKFELFAKFQIISIKTARKIKKLPTDIYNMRI